MKSASIWIILQWETKNNISNVSYCLKAYLVIKLQFSLLCIDLGSNECEVWNGKTFSVLTQKPSCTLVVPNHHTCLYLIRYWKEVVLFLICKTEAIFTSIYCILGYNKHFVIHLSIYLSMRLSLKAILEYSTIYSYSTF